MELTAEQVQKRAEKIQDEINELIVAVQIETKGNLSYQDCKNVCIFRKLAELELKIEDMQSRQNLNLY